MIRILKPLALVFLTCFITPIFAQFEGVIEFDKSSTWDTTRYVYYIKGDNVRIEEIGSDGKVQGVMLVNTKSQTAQSLSPERKLYMDLEPSKAQFIPIKDVEISKGKKSKTIAGYKCQEITVKNPEQNTVITYYIGQDNFHFFDGLLVALNRKDKMATYYQQLEGLQNDFPFQAIERDMNGKQRSSLTVTSVQKKPLQSELFKLPADYKKFEK